MRRLVLWLTKFLMNASAAALVLLNAPYPQSAKVTANTKSILTPASNAVLVLRPALWVHPLRPDHN